MNRAWWGNQLWRLSSWPEARRFHSGLHQLEETQKFRLQDLLRNQSSTVFGRRHSVGSIRHYEEFRDRVPLFLYEDLLPYLAQPQGLSREPVRVWEPTGGSSGGSKWIPWTASLQAEFRRAVAVWMWHLFAQHPGVIGGRGYWQLTPKTEISRPAWLEGESAGFASDGEYLGPLGRLLERWVLVSPSAGASRDSAEPPQNSAPRGNNAPGDLPEAPEAPANLNGDAFWSGTVRALLEAPDLRLISCWSPSFLLCLHDQFLRHAGAWEPQRWWPHLRLLSCWTRGPSASYLDRVTQLFPQVAIQPKGLLSTEAITTLPLGELTPLAYRSHFFELLTAEGSRPSWEWEVGEVGTVVVTTGGGLTRYLTNDRVRVTGMLGRVPCLDFLGREGVSDQRGEKLSLSFLEPLVRAISGFAMLAYEDGGYVLFVDGGEPAVERRQLIPRIENALLESYTYRDCRNLGQLLPLRGFLIEGDALAQYGRICSQHLGQREGAAKAVSFHSYQGWSRAFQGRFL